MTNHLNDVFVHCWLILQVTPLINVITICITIDKKLLPYDVILRQHYLANETSVIP